MREGSEGESRESAGGGADEYCADKKPILKSNLRSLPLLVKRGRGCPRGLLVKRGWAARAPGCAPRAVVTGRHGLAPWAPADP